MSINNNAPTVMDTSNAPNTLVVLVASNISFPDSTKIVAVLDNLLVSYSKESID